jgi:two-component system C4-dicarboxylate transport response regulator DctD
VAEYEAALIRSVLRQTGGSVVEALQLLKIPRKTLYDKMARHGIDPSVFR